MRERERGERERERECVCVECVSNTETGTQGAVTSTTSSRIKAVALA